MSKINNYDVYNERMLKTIDDKLFWLEELKDDIRIIVDYGCGDGSLLERIHSLYPGKYILIGYDNNEYMLNEAREKFKEIGNTLFLNNFATLKNAINAFHGKKVINFSSVFHEVFTYKKPDEYEYDPFILFSDVCMDYIVVRDMHYDAENIFSNDLFRKAKTHPLFNDYIGHRKLNDQTLVEFFLKYDYTENWERERDEHYFFDYEILEKCLHKNQYVCIYKEKFAIPYIRNKVLQDFEINFNFNTHIKAIYKKEKGL